MHRNDPNAVREREAIIALRKKYPNDGAAVLARKISTNQQSDFIEGDRMLVSTARLRPYFSTYSVIRRYDALVKKNNATAAAGV